LGCSDHHPDFSASGMTMIRSTSILLATALLLSACSIDLAEGNPTQPAQPTPIPDSPTPKILIAPFRTATPSPAPPPAALPMPTVMVPVTWGRLGLSGELLFITANPSNSRNGFTASLRQLDLASGALSSVFQPPDDSWIDSFSVSPDRRRIALAYAPPPSSLGMPVGDTGLYILPWDEPRIPQVLLSPTEKQDLYFNPVWSPDGRYLYYVHIEPQGTSGIYKYSIERIATIGGQPMVVLENAYWPQLSPDGQKLVYVTNEPSGSLFDLYIADPDGTHARKIDLPASFPAADAPFFSPDSKTLYFSAIDVVSSAGPTWLERLLGVQVASAHSVPSDWWRIPVAGGQAERITHIADTGLIGAFAPDGKRIAFICSSGVFIMDSDGGGLTTLLANTDAFGSTAWVPR
jgi:Tol biopolymer transport system component